MNRILFFVFIVSLLSCNNDDDKSGAINLRFHLEYDGEPMEMFKNYPYPDTNEPIYFTRLSFFIANIKLNKNSGNNMSSTTIKDIDFLDLTPAFTGSIPSNGFEYKIDNVPVGDYHELYFGLGVPTDLNKKSPADYPVSSVLSNNTEYWSSWASYVFFKTEGSITFNDSAPNESDFALHLGGDDAYRPVSLPKLMIVKENSVTNVDVTLDMKHFFKGNKTYDIKATPLIHSQSQHAQTEELMDNLRNAFQ